MKKQLAVLLALLLISATAAACGKTNAPQQSAAVTTQLPAVTEIQTEVQTEAAFVLTLDGVDYPKDAAEIRASSVSAEVLDQLTQMTGLKQVTVTEGDGENLEQLRAYCDEKGIAFRAELAGQTVTDETAELTVPNVTEAQLRLLALMPKLKTLHFPEPEAPAESLLALRMTLSETVITWEKTLLGMTFSNDAVEIDLTPVIALAEGQSIGDKTAYDYGLEFQTMGTQEEPRKTAKILPEHPIASKWEATAQLIEAVETAMPYFPAAEKVLMCGAMMDDEAMAQFRETHRGDYKVVWSVICGDMAVRTDATFFMPTKYFVEQGAFSDMYAYNLRYCEDMVSMDFGHMNVTDLDFVRYMPNLQYLVLSWTLVRDLTPLSDCKSLKFLEINWIDGTLDYLPLVGCTALEDLNLGETSGDITPVLQMTWLKNLWLVGCKDINYEKAKDMLPNTNLGYYYSDPVVGWRELPNYYAMRDTLLMFYMQ